MKKYIYIFCVLIMALAACSNEQEETSQGSSNIDDSLEGLTYNMETESWSPMMAQFLNELDKPRVQGAYELAIQHPDVLDYVPCYCGCHDSNGHEHVRHCFVEDYNENIAELDNMGFGCAICIETAEIAVAKYEEGESLPDIRNYIDDKYSGNGVGPTPTPKPEG